MQATPQLDVRRFAGINTLLHPATDVNPDDPASFASIINADLFQEGTLRPRCGLGRPDSWLGAFGVPGKMETGYPASASFGTAVLSLHAIDFRRRQAPAPVNKEDGTNTSTTGTLSDLATGLSSVAIWTSVLGQGSLNYFTNGTDAPSVWDGYSATWRNWGIVAPTTTPTAADSGAGGQLSIGTYQYYYAFLNSSSGCYSTVSPLSNAIVQTVALHKITVSTIQAAPSPADSQVDKVRIFRNAAGDSSTFYKLADITIGTTSYVDSTVSDIALQQNDVMFSDSSPPDGKYPYCAFFNGRMLLYGSRTETTGTAQATATSASIVGTGTEWKASHVGQYIVFGSDTAKYTIATVTDATHATITPVYAGSSASGKSFSIYPVRGSDVAWSRSTNFESFPFGNSVGVYEGDGDNPTGFLTCGNTPFLAKETHIYRFSYATNPDPVNGEGAIYNILENRGMLNSHCSVTIANTAFVMDRQGIYQFDGQDATDIDLAIRRILRPSSETLQVDWSKSDAFHAVWEPKSNLVCFFVCMQGYGANPQHVLCFDRDRQRWTCWYFEQVICCSLLLKDGNGILRAWVGDSNGYIWALGVLQGTEGCGVGYFIEGPATGGSATTVTISAFGGKTFFSTGLALKGVSVEITGGTGAGQLQIIQSNTDTQLNVAAFSPAPDATSTIRVGRIQLSALTQWYSLGLAAAKKGIKGVVFFFEPTADDTTLSVQVYYDMSASVYTGWSAANQSDGLEIPYTATTDGIVKIHLNQADGRVFVPLSIRDARLLRFALTWDQVNHSQALLGFSLFSEESVSGNLRTG